MTTHFVDDQGRYMGGFGDGAEPESSSWISLGDNAPQYADQRWQFPGWGLSPSRLRIAEDAWRAEQMTIASESANAIEFGDPDAPAGTVGEWRAYWVALKNWTEGSGDYPDVSRRPKRPA